MGAPFLGRLFARVSLPSTAGAELRALATRGSIVFVMQTAGWLNAAYVRWMARSLGLPPVRTVLGAAGVPRLLLGRRGTLTALRETIGSRAAALVFLRRPRALSTRPSAAADPFPALVHQQRDLAHPIFFVPLLFVWSRRAKRLRPSVFDLLFGSSEAPGALATLFGFLRSHRRAFVRLGRPIDTQDFVGARSVETPAQLARKLRGVLSYHLGREIRAVLGPPFKDAARIRDEVLRDRNLREAIAALAAESGRAETDLEADARSHVRGMAADMKPWLFEILRPIISWICDRLYDGIEIDEAGLDAVRAAVSAGPTVLCPSHKSHMDYVILTYLFYTRGLLPPHVAAGDNLAFFPFASLARACGGFFIRRSFRGDRLYAAVVRAYVKRLQRDGFPQEFFIEGGRSRTGKLLPPKTGLLSMQVDAWLEGASGTASDDSGPPLTFMPVAIDYERLAEGGSHARELGGGEKRKESFAALLGARKILRSGHGRIYVAFGRPIAVSAVASERGGLAAVAADRRPFVHHLALRIAHGISDATTVTPVGLLAAALLAEPADAVPAGAVNSRVALLRAIARAADVHVAVELDGSTCDVRSPGPIADAASLLQRIGLVASTGEGEGWGLVAVRARRQELDFHRNAVIHRFVAPALVAAGLLGATGVEARRRTRWLSRLLKLEFLYRPGVPFDDIYDATCGQLEQLGAIATPRSLEFLAAFLRPSLETYRWAAAIAAAFVRGDRASFVSAVLERGRSELTGASVRFPESISKPTADNALAWLIDAGFVSASESDELTVSGEQQTRAAALGREIDGALRTTGSSAS